MGSCFFGGSSGTRLQFHPLGENKGADAIELASGNTPRGVAFDCSSPFLVIKKSDTLMGIGLFGGSSGTRTLDPRLKRALLYQLS